jgi:hypothetical protein
MGATQGEGDQKSELHRSTLYSGLPVIQKLLLSMMVCWFAAASTPAQNSIPKSIPASQLAVLDLITAAQLKGDLAFLASDALQGRFTPSPGLDVAADFIASQFAAAGLKPGGDQGYFQVAHMVERSTPKLGSPMVLQHGSESLRIPVDSMLLFSTSQAADVQRAPIVAFPARDAQALKGVDLTGKAVLVEQPAFETMKEDDLIVAYRRMVAFDNQVTQLHAALEIVLTNQLGHPGARLIAGAQASSGQTPVIQVKDEQLVNLIKQPKAAEGWAASVNIPAPQDRPVVARNVIGILPGSDPKLKDTAVLLTAHYDHIGTRDTGARMAPPPKPNEANDHIYNGANDDGSGTVSVIEIARALTALNPHPKRSIVFMTFFGEERGELGSKYYGEHPVFPVSQTIADINLEQVGRTDEIKDGKPAPQVNTASLTGFDYSEVTEYLQRAGRELGITVFKDPEASDSYFTRSDNDALAQQGVPAHSLCVAFDYPDYHGLGDEWQKIDYQNMTRVDRMIALALMRIADSPTAPQWNANNPRTVPFREAQKKWGGGSGGPASSSEAR